MGPSPAGAAGALIDYTALSLSEVRAGLDEVASDAQATFGGLDATQLNWRPDAARWSVAQCFEHLITSNRLMLRAAEDATSHARPRTIWQRLPLLPGFYGRMLIRTQGPVVGRKFTSPPNSTPSASANTADVISRFVEQHREIVARLQTIDEGHAARTIMTSPFIRVVTYSVLDGLRLVVAHDRRHVEQARRVTQSPGFPGAGGSA